MLLLDTNALLWLSAGSEHLGPIARAAIEDAIDQSTARFSAISVWEVAILVRKGRYALGQSVAAWRSDLLEVGLAEARLDGVTAALAGSYPNLHEDPADRFIAATAVRIGATLVTSDPRLISWANTSVGLSALDARL
jgi:PIN domain nuclease of toxin-antitoxin system